MLVLLLAGSNSSLVTKRLTYLGYATNELAVTVGAAQQPLVLRTMLVSPLLTVSFS